MKYLIDTCVISELVKSRPNAYVVKWIDGCNQDSLYLSVLSIGEIQKGIAKLLDKVRRDTLQQWLDNDLHSRFFGRILPITEEIACTWGIIQGDAEKKGTPIPTIDGLLGATAITHNLTIVSRNTIDFVHTGATVLDPWQRA